MKSILIVVDMQTDFITGALGTQEARAISAAVAKRIIQARGMEESICFTLDTHHLDYLSTAEGRSLPVEHCIFGSEGHKLARGVRELRQPDDMTFEKPSFGSERLAEWLLEVAERRGTPDGHGLRIELCGVCTDICVVTNALLIKTRLPECTVVVQAHLCAGTTPEKHLAALEVMRSCQIEVLP